MKIVGIITNHTQISVIIKNKKYLDMVEVRVDYLLNKKISLDSVKKILIDIKKQVKLPLILTVRLNKDGGKYPVDDKNRAAIIRSLAGYADYVDIEINSKYLDLLYKWITTGKHKINLILSYHNFNQLPELSKLKQLYLKSIKYKPYTVKFAVTVNKFKSLSKLITFRNWIKSNKSNVPATIIPMSEKWFGSIGRVLFPLLGSELSYGCIDKQVAPGQLNIRDLHKLLH